MSDLGEKQKKKKEDLVKMDVGCIIDCGMTRG